MGCIETAGALTESDSEGCTSTNRVVLQLIVHETKGEHQCVQQDPDEEEDTSTTLVNHPVSPFLAEAVGLVGTTGGGGGIGSLETLQPPTFSLVPLQMACTCLYGIVVGHIRVLFYMGYLAIGKVEARVALRGGHGWGVLAYVYDVLRGEQIKEYGEDRPAIKAKAYCKEKSEVKAKKRKEGQPGRT